MNNSVCCRRLLGVVNARRLAARRLLTRGCHGKHQTPFNSNIIATTPRVGAVVLAAGGITIATLFAMSHDSGPKLAPPHYQEALAQFREIVGVERVSLDSDDCEDRGKDKWSYHGAALPDVIVYPNSTEEVSQVLAVCNKHRIPVIPYGGGTSLEGHTSAPQGGVCLDMQNMDRILSVNAQDMDVVVQPAVGWEALNAWLARTGTGLFFPVDPGPGASIGGMIGTRCSGTNAVRYGTMRDWVLSLTAVLPDGSVVRTGQRARKSSAGYDLTRLFVGSEGTLGVVTQATLKLAQIPECEAVAVCNFPSVEAAANTVIRLTQRGVTLRCVELLDAPMMKALNSSFSLGYPERPTLFFKFAGSPAVVQESAQRTREECDSHGGARFQWSKDEKGREQLWHARKAALFAVAAMDPDRSPWATDVCVPVSRLAECITAAQADVEASSLYAPIVGHVGDGNFHLAIMVDPSDPREMAEARALNKRMVHRAIAAGGTCTGEHGVGVGKREYLEEELGGGALELMRRLKAACDPNGIMNPDKVLLSAASKKQ